MNSELKRLTSFHVSFNVLCHYQFTGSPAEFAEKGLYYDSAVGIRCAFCSFYFSLSNSPDSELFFDKPGYVHVRQNPQCPHMRGISERIPHHNLPLYRHSVHKMVEYDFRLELVRLQSFYRIPSTFGSRFDQTRVRERAARKGLYYDCQAIRCAFCSFERFEVGDWVESHAPCPFSEGKNFRDRLESRIMIEYENVPIAETDALCYPKTPEMENIWNRYETFYEWLHEPRIRRKDLAEAGFYFRRVRDFVTCYWCDVTLGYWQPDDVPRFEHFRKNPRCRVALLALVSNEKIWLARKGLELESEKRMLSRAEFEKLNGENVILKREAEKNEDLMSCVVCFERFRNVLFLKCKHFVCCEKCSLRINDMCPLCRKPISEKIKVFL